jgi:hypothetical protein
MPLTALIDPLQTSNAVQALPKWLSAILRQYDEQIPDSKAPNPKQIPSPKSKGSKQPSERFRLREQAIQAKSVSVIWIWSLRIQVPKGRAIAIGDLGCQGKTELSLFRVEPLFPVRPPDPVSFRLPYWFEQRRPLFSSALSAMAL